jgi:hypothetical protein
VFYINLPLGAVTLLTVIFILKIKEKSSGNLYNRFMEIDWLGCFSLIVAVGCFLIVIQGGGSLYAWNSAVIISLSCVSLISTMFLIYVEGFLAKNPIIPRDFFKSAELIGVFSTSFCVGAVFFLLVFYTPLYFQSVFGYSATKAGIATFPLILGLVVFSIIGMLILNS